MKKPLIITIIILLGIGGYFIYNHFTAQKALGAWDLVPQETVLVYESGNCEDCVTQIRNSPVSALIRKAALLNAGKDSITIFQDLATSLTDPTLISLHVTKRDEFDFTYYVKASPSFIGKLNATQDALLKIKGSKSRQREFNNIIINEIEINKSVFSWIAIGENWVGSFSPVLIEDVIRTYQGSPSFKRALGNVYHLHSVKNDGGNLFINLSSLAKWFSLFVKGDGANMIRDFGRAALLDTKVAGDQIVLNGFSANTDNKTFLAAFSDQDPVPFSLRSIISNRALMVSSYGFTDAAKFFSRLDQSAQKPVRDSLAIVLNDAKVDGDNLFKNFSGELAICWLEGSRETLMPVLIIQDSEGAEKWSDLFRKVAETKVTDSLFVDNFSSYEILGLPSYRFPEKLFSPLVSGFENSYYAQVGNSICMAEDIEELKRFLKDIDQENTWGKSVAQNKFFESTLLEANISLFINTPRVWSLLESSLQPKWKVFLNENREVIGSLGMGSIQFSHLNDNFYTNVSWALHEKDKVPEATPRAQFMTIFDAGISSMAVVDSHVDRSKEILIQESAKNLTLLSADGKINWKLPLEDHIQGQVHQIDFLSNGKLQYFFCTPGMIHIVDRLGNYVKPYPVAIEEKNIEHVTVVDYDHSRNYRFLIASRDGNLWIYDKSGQNLEGWQPRRVEGRLLNPPRHHRLLGRDYMLAIRTDGKVYLMNRRGELMPNFPLDLDARLAGDYYINRGRSAAETTITVVSNDGWRINFNLQGKILSREVLVKTSLNAKFSLCAEREDKSYLIVRQESAHFTVFDDKLNEIIRSDYIGNDKATVDFMSFGNGRNYIAIVDQSQELGYLYDKSGKLITPIPVESSQLEVQPLENGKTRIFTVVDNTFRTTFLP